jgi:hypothetical protein
MDDVRRVDPTIRKLEAELRNALRAWQIRRAVEEARARGLGNPIHVACCRFGVSRWTVHRALERTKK